MGYYTRFDINIYDKDTKASLFDNPNTVDKWETIMREIIAKVMNDPPEEIPGKEIYWFFDEKHKWYDHVEDLLNVSEMFPDVIIAVEGEGEEACDLWRKYFLNGDYEECFAEIVYPKSKFMEG